MPYKHNEPDLCDKADALRFHCDAAQATKVAVGVAILNRMLDLGRPNSGRVA